MASPALIVLAASTAWAEPLPPGAAACLACHVDGGGGPKDTSPDSLPDLGRLSAQAIEDALAAYRSGARAGTVMPRIAKGFTESESRAIARALGRDGTAGR